MFRTLLVFTCLCFGTINSANADGLCNLVGRQSQCNCQRCQQRRAAAHGTSYRRPGIGGSIRPRQRTFGLPFGRTYYGDRYFGNFNNRFFGPQYGYF